MLFLKEVTSNKKCEVNIDYYVPFTVNLENKKPYTSKTCWRIGNFKNSLMEISIDEKSGILRDITLISVNKSHLMDATLENVDVVESGTPVFLLNGNIKNGLCNQVMDFHVYLNKEAIIVNLSEESHSCKVVELERVRFGFDKDNKLISVIIKELSNDEYKELKDSLKL